MIAYNATKKYPHEICDELIKVVEKLPPDVPGEDVMERLYVIYKIEHGIEQANAVEKISQDEAMKRIRIKS